MAMQAEKIPLDLSLFPDAPLEAKLRAARLAVENVLKPVSSSFVIVIIKGMEPAKLEETRSNLNRKIREYHEKGYSHIKYALGPKVNYHPSSGYYIAVGAKVK
jgi:hypothetical protein